MKRLFLITLLPVLVLAQDKRALTIDEAIQLGMHNSTSVHISEAKALAADAKAAEAHAARLPSLKLQASYTRLSDVQPFAVQLPSAPGPVIISPTVLDQYASRVSLQQPLFTGFRLVNAADAAEYSHEASRFDVAGERAQTVYNVRVAYWSVYKALEVQRVVDENVEITRVHVADVTQMVAHGLATRNEVLKVEVQLSTAQLAQLESANNVKNAMMGLNNLIGLPLDTEIRITSPINAGTAQTQSAVALTHQALASRADVMAAEMRTNAAGASVAAANGGWFPQISLFGNFSYSRPNPRIMPTKDEFKDTWDVGVSLSWDIWNWGATKHQSEQAEAVHSQTRFALEQLKDNVSLEVHQSYLTLVQSQQKITVASTAINQAEENYRMTREKFTQGTASNTELLDAEIALLQSQLHYTVALVDDELAHARFARVMGREQ